LSWLEGGSDAGPNRQPLPTANRRQIEALLAKYANHLLEKDRFLDAVELYRKVGFFTGWLGGGVAPFLPL
jgi:hypothetical protein